MSFRSVIFRTDVCPIYLSHSGHQNSFEKICVVLSSLCFVVTYGVEKKYEVTLIVIYPHTLNKFLNSAVKATFKFLESARVV